MAAHAGSTVDLADLRLAAVRQFLCICPEAVVSRYRYPDDAGFWESVELSATVHSQRVATEEIFREGCSWVWQRGLSCTSYLSYLSTGTTITKLF